MASTRFPGKPLVDLAGKPMIQWVVEAARRAAFADDVLVATPDAEIIDAARLIGVTAVLTSLEHPSGTDRIAEVAESQPAEIYVNVQGDEPLISPETIAAAAAPLLQDASVAMGSVWASCEAEEEDNPAVVKVVTDRENNALYFSRHAIPFPRHAQARGLKKHIGIYAYRRDVLQAFSTWPPGELETTESLEQLRFLENGISIRMSEGRGSELAVDTPEQAEAVRRLLAARSAT